MKILLSVLSLIVLTGCASSAEIRAKKLASFQQECEAYGFVKGTDKFSDCMMTVSQRAIDEKNRAAEKRSHDRDRAAYERAERNKTYNKQPSLSDYSLGGQSLNCTSTQMGNTINTNCN